MERIPTFLRKSLSTISSNHDDPSLVECITQAIFSEVTNREVHKLRDMFDSYDFPSLVSHRASDKMIENR